MMPHPLVHYAEELRSAVDARDFRLAEAVLHKYAACFWSDTRTRPEVESAMKLLQWAIDAIRADKALISGELLRLKSIFDAYRVTKNQHTWGLEG
jgi:hypothetical protein